MLQGDYTGADESSLFKSRKMTPFLVRPVKIQKVCDWKEDGEAFCGPEFSDFVFSNGYKVLSGKKSWGFRSTCIRIMYTLSVNF